jgi:hypothetical protein
MSTHIQTARVVKLNTDNCAVWCVKVRYLLVYHGLQKVELGKDVPGILALAQPHRHDQCQSGPHINADTLMMPGHDQCQSALSLYLPGDAAVKKK